MRFNRFQILTHLLCLLPFVWLVAGYAADSLTADPIQAVTQRTGQTAIRLLLIGLALTPVNTVLGFKPARQVKRAVGLYAFFYALLHFLTFSVLDYGLWFYEILREMSEKRYLVVGLAAFLLLLPLAVTSTRGWKKRLGVWWKRIHRSAYVITALAILHYLWVVKADIRLPVVYALILLVLLILRLPPVKQWFLVRQPAWIEPVNQFFSR